MNRFICIHGHFYQPPRENAWLDEIEIQESATPYHDWNERITDECYGPNGVSRILNEEGKIVDIVNNYSKMSFNFGPTLLSWMEQKNPKVYQSILEADKISRQHFNGHGSAIAQVYNHMIMPLATRADKETQVKWALYDFEQRFGRKSRGIWLAETAVDTETLEMLAENEIAFTILAPSQARRFRRKGEGHWIDGIDTRRPYSCLLPSGKSIALFFYDGDRSQNVAFKGILNDGKKFAHSLTDGFEDNFDGPQLVNIATDGESYGHHHRNGDMALAYCIRYIENNHLARVTNYSEYLDLFPPDFEVEIVENSSWSCAHGIERWRSNCGCHTGGPGHWNQEWRIGLRESLDWLAQAFQEVFQIEMGRLGVDYSNLRNNYIEVILDRSPANIERFVKKYIKVELLSWQITKVIRILEMQKQAMYMYTSCGWFFNDVSGIETVQILQYANRGIQLAETESDVLLEQEFKKRLAASFSNLSEHGTGSDIYDKFVTSKRLTLTKVGMHYAVSSLFAEEEEEINVLNYSCNSELFDRFKSGINVLAAGRTKVKSRVTLSRKYFSFAILYLGNHHLIGNTSNNLSEEDYQLFRDKAEAAFMANNISKVLDIIQEYFTDKSFSFFDLFKDEQIKVVDRVLEKNIERAINSYEKINEASYSLLSVMRDANIPIPTILQQNLETVLYTRLRALFGNESILVSIPKLEKAINNIERWEAKLPNEQFNYIVTNKIRQQIDEFQSEKNGVQVLQNIFAILEQLERVSISPGINELQDFVFHLIKKNALPADLRQAAIRLGTLINLELSKESISSN